MHQSKPSYWILATLLVAALPACRGGGSNPFALDAEPIDPDLVQAGGDLFCPNSGGRLPFDVESAPGFVDATVPDHVVRGNAANHYLFDFVGTPDEDQRIRVVGAYDPQNALNPRTLPAGEWISLWSREVSGETNLWVQLGRGQTDDDGGVDFHFAGEDRFPTGRHPVWAVVEGDRSCAEGGIFVFPTGTRFVVTDIDGTLTTSDDEFLSQLNNVAYYPQQHPGATRLHQVWAAKGYEIVYLTARPFAGRLLTREWLRGDEFPFGYVETAESFVFGDSAVTYKRGFIRRMADKGFVFDYAYGNAESDLIAYEEGNIPKDRTFSIEDASGKRNTQPIPDDDYNPHIAGFVNGRPDAAQPAGIPPREAWDPGSFLR